MKVKFYILTALLSIAAARGYSGEKSVVVPGAQVIKLASGFNYAAGLASDRAGNIFFSDVFNNRIHKWSLDGKLTTFRENSDGAFGLSFDKNGNLLACETGRRRLVSISKQGKVEVLADKYQDILFNHLSNLWIDPKGGIYFTDRRWGKEKMEQGGPYVYYLSHDRNDIKRVIEDMVMQKGLIGTPDGKILYVADHDRDDKRRGKVFRYTINKDGTLSNKKLFAPEGPAGMTIDNRGNVYMASRRWAVAVYNKNGEEIEAIAVPESPTDVCFGGEDKRTLFITASTSLYSVRMRVSGGGIEWIDESS